MSCSPDTDKFIRELGADEVIRDGKGLADMGGVDSVLGTSNSNDAMMDIIQGLRPDGKFVLMGFEAKPLAHAASGKVKTIAETYTLDDINKAYERVVEGKVRFRAVIQI